MHRRDFLKTMLLAAPAVILAGPPKSWAARLFVRASGQYLEISSAVVTATPFSMSIWGYPVSLGIAQGLMGVGQNGDANHSLFVENNNFLLARTRSNTSVISSAQQNVQVTINTWMHVGGVWASDSSRELYKNGVSVATNTTTATVTGMNLSRIGAEMISAVKWDGRLAHAAIWANTALNPGEMAALASGAPVFKIRPSAVVAYVPIWGQNAPEIDVAAARAWPFIGTGTPAEAPGPPVGLWRTY